MNNHSILSGTHVGAIGEKKWKPLKDRKRTQKIALKAKK